MMNYYRGAVADFVKVGRNKKDVLSSAEHYLSTFQILNLLPFNFLLLYAFDIVNEWSVFISVILLVLTLKITNAKILRRIDLNKAYKKEWHHLIWFTRCIVIGQAVVAFLTACAVFWLITPVA